MASTAPFPSSPHPPRPSHSPFPSLLEPRHFAYHSATGRWLLTGASAGVREGERCTPVAVLRYAAPEVEGDRGWWVVA